MIHIACYLSFWLPTDMPTTAAIFDPWLEKYYDNIIEKNQTKTLGKVLIANVETKCLNIQHHRNIRTCFCLFSKSKLVWVQSACSWLNT